MRIMLVANHESPYGAPMATLRLAKGLRDRGHEVSAYFLYRDERIESPYFDYEVLWPDRRPRLLDYWRMFIRTCRTVRRAQPDAVISFMPLAGIFAQLAAFLARVPTRVVSHRAPVNTYQPIIRWLDTLMAYCGCYTDVVAVSGSVKTSCAHYPSRLIERTVVVHNGLLDWKASPKTKAEARASLDLPADAFVLATVGRIEEQKNFKFLLPIVAKVDDVVLVIAGAGSLRGELEQLIEKLAIRSQVRLLGLVSHNHVPDVLAAADLFVQPSLYEGQSNALLEALYAGLPVLSSNIPEQIETITHEDGTVAGLVLSLDDPDSCVRAVERFRSDPALMEHARSVAELRAAALSFDRMISGFEATLRRDAFGERDHQPA